MYRLAADFLASPKRCSCTPILQKRWRKTSNIPNPKRLQQQVEKFMVQKNFEKKLYDKDDGELVKYSKRLAPQARMNPKTLNPGIIQRERTISNLLKNEIQNLIDSGDLGEEVQLLNLTITKALMSSQNVCRVLWEPCMSAKDLEISETLNGLSGTLRHKLMSNHVMNNVPTIHFYMDGGAYRSAMADKILKSEELDTGEEEEEIAVNPEAVEDRPNSLFGLDRENLFAKLTVLKKGNKVDKS